VRRFWAGGSGGKGQVCPLWCLRPGGLPAPRASVVRKPLSHSACGLEFSWLLGLGSGRDSVSTGLEAVGPGESGRSPGPWQNPLAVDPAVSGSDQAELSGGQTKRCCFAFCVVRSPPPVWVLE